MVRFANAVVGPADAEDLAAIVMTRVLSRDGWESLADLRAYLFRSVVNEARSSRRSTQRRLRREAFGAELAAPPAVTLRADVLDAVGRLTPRQRALTYLVYWQDLPVVDAAAELGVSVRTAERELANARRRLEVLLR
ncbi:MAG: sigma-70 family RNA polymerase sigma factor [Ilumatobacter sp.]|nr:sigma-70 family RNA polymerase sigma factor [Ilumatobacter sp.]MCB0982601.1 sigma-70 family RNA polymerase sigma factor [Ilumatobacter sp.]